PAMIQAFFHNQGVLENDPIPSQPKTVFYDAQLSHLIYPFNPQRGKALLEQHGWHLHNGVMEKHGVKLAFTLLYVSGSNSAANIVQLVKQDWAQEGIQVSLQSGPFDQVLSTAQQSDPQKWNMAFWGTSSWTYEPDYYPTGGSFYLTGAGANQGGYNDRNMDRLILRSYAPGTPQQIRQALDAYLSYAAHQLPVLFLPYTPSFNEHATDIHGVVSTYNPITTFMYPNHWTISG
ncbi:MAG: ABC transporter substrate-binding protein, partial [Sulfobacillus thermosulfidooxidans]